MKSRQWRKRLADGATYVVLSLAVVVSIGPIAWLLLTSIEPSALTYTRQPTLVFHPTLENYDQVLIQSSFLQNLINSVVVCIASVVIAVVLGFLAAYSLSRFRLRRGEDVAFWILSNRMLPPIAIVIPIYVILGNINGLDQYWSLIAVYAAANAPYAVWLLRGFLLDIPQELDQAAMVDGCSHLQVMRRIILPLCLGSILSTGVFLFVLTWSEFLFAFMLTSANTKTLPVAIASLITDQGIQWGNMTAAGTMLVIPLIVAFFFVQKQLVRGLTFGAIK